MTERGSAGQADLIGGLVGADPAEAGMPQQTVAADLPILDIGDQHRLDPPRRRRTAASAGSSSGLVLRRISSSAARRVCRDSVENPVPTPPIQRNRPWECARPGPGRRRWPRFGPEPGIAPTMTASVEARSTVLLHAGGKATPRR